MNTPNDLTALPTPRPHLGKVYRCPLCDYPCGHRACCVELALNPKLRDLFADEREEGRLEAQRMRRRVDRRSQPYPSALS